jgi:hypothetical protein
MEYYPQLLIIRKLTQEDKHAWVARRLAALPTDVR